MHALSGRDVQAVTHELRCMSRMKYSVSAFHPSPRQMCLQAWNQCLARHKMHVSLEMLLCAFHETLRAGDARAQRQSKCDRVVIVKCPMQSIVPRRVLAFTHIVMTQRQGSS